MKKTLFTLIILVQVIFAIGQETKPSGLKLIQSPSFHYNPVDSAVWMYKNSSYLWNRVNYQHWSIKTDSILNPVKLTARDKLNLRDSPSINWTLTSLNDSTKEMSANVGDIDVALGVHSLPAYTDNNNGSITIATGVYVFPVNAAGDGPYRKDTIAGATFTLTDNATNYIVGNLNNGSPIIENITNVALINNRSIFPIYTIYRVGNKLSIIDWDNPAVALSNKLMERFVKTERFAIEPNSLMIDEAPTRLITLTAGYVWTGPARLILTPFISSTDALYHYYHVAGVWTKQTVTTYNNSQYDNGTALQTLNPNKYAVNWVWRDVATNRSECYMVLGGDNYTLDEARASQIPSDLPQEIATNSILVGRIIVKEAATVATEISSAFEKVFTGGASGGSYNALPKAKYVPIWNATADSLLASPIKSYGIDTIQISTQGTNTLRIGKRSSSQVLDANYIGYGNNLIGYTASPLITSGYYNLSIGHSSGYNIGEGYYNSQVGAFSAPYLTHGDRNTILGANAGRDGVNNTAQYNVTLEDDMVLVGYGATKNNASTITNGIAIGSGAKVLLSNQAVIGNDNITSTLLKGRVTAKDLQIINNGTGADTALISTFKGLNSLGYNIWVGNGGQSSVGEAATSKGSYNSFMGISAGKRSTTGFYNTGVGFASQGWTTASYNNTGVGAYTLLWNRVGDNNTAVGHEAGTWEAITGSLEDPIKSTFIGAGTKASADGNTNETVIGAFAVGRGSNTVTIGDSATVQRTFIRGAIQQPKIGEYTTNYTSFEADGTMVMTGSATVWDDMGGDAIGLQKIGARVTDNTAENTVDYTTLSALTDYIYTSVQLSHRYKSGSTVYPHIHFMQTTDSVPNFLFQYRWQKMGTAKVTSWTNLKCKGQVFTYTAGTTMHQIAKTFNGITVAGSGISDIIQFRVIRDNANTSGVFSGTDPVNATTAVMSFDVHYEADTMGSRTEGTK